MKMKYVNGQQDFVLYISLSFIVFSTQYFNIVSTFLIGSTAMYLEQLYITRVETLLTDGIFQTEDLRKISATSIKCGCLRGRHFGPWLWLPSWCHLSRNGAGHTVWINLCLSPGYSETGLVGGKVAHWDTPISVKRRWEKEGLDGGGQSHLCGLSGGGSGIDSEKKGGGECQMWRQHALITVLWLFEWHCEKPLLPGLTSTLLTAPPASDGKAWPCKFFLYPLLLVLCFSGFICFPWADFCHLPPKQHYFLSHTHAILVLSLSGWVFEVEFSLVYCWCSQRLYFLSHGQIAGHVNQCVGMLLGARLEAQGQAGV